MRTVHPHLRGAYGLGCVSLVYQDRFIPTYVGHTGSIVCSLVWDSVHPHLRGAYIGPPWKPRSTTGSSPPTWGIRGICSEGLCGPRFIPTYVGHTIQGGDLMVVKRVHPHLRGAYLNGTTGATISCGSSPPTWGIHWTAVRKMAGFSHFSYDFTRKSYFVQGLVFFGVIGAEAFPTHRRGRNQCLPGAHGGSVRNL